MKVMIINGPNLNLLGIRETEKYGLTSYEQLCRDLVKYGEEKGIEVILRQSNHEGDLMDWMQEAYFQKMDGIILNAGGYSHTSIALHDAILSLPIPVVEVHITDILKREYFRQTSMLSSVAKHVIQGKGVQGYFLALDWFLGGNV